MVTLRIIHAKNQPPMSKTVAYRPRTHTQTQTDRQPEVDFQISKKYLRAKIIII